MFIISILKFSFLFTFSLVLSVKYIFFKLICDEVSVVN